ncbi:MAG: hypothetical protein HZA46_22195 [Planctomycetales bacterium]|nr:hypothetical protein [Planctomycetales bacterium]
MKSTRLPERGYMIVPAGSLSPCRMTDIADRGQSAPVLVSSHTGGGGAERLAPWMFVDSRQVRLNEVRPEHARVLRCVNRWGLDVAVNTLVEHIR